MNYTQNRVIAGFACLVALLVWIDWQTSQPLHYANHNAETQQTAEQKPSGQESPLSNIFAGLLVIATFSLGIIAYIQWKDSRILQRAYLSVKPLGAEPYKNAPDKMDVKIEVGNVGRLPAQGVRWIVYRQFSRDPRLKRFPIDEKKLEGGGMVIAPGTFALKSCRNISRCQIESFKKGMGQRDRFLYVWGLVRYLDGFGKSRFAYFCHRYNMAAEVNLRIDTIDARQHEYGKNDAD